MANFTDNSLAVGFQNALQKLAPRPIVAQRDPLPIDTAPTGNTWVNTLTNTVWVNAGLLNGATVWNIMETAGQGGNFPTIHVTGVSTLDGAVVGGAAIGAATTLTAGTGITSTTGNIVATAGQVNAGTTMTAGTGLTVTTGNATVTAGKLTAVSVFASGDSGAGVVAQTALTNVTLAAAANVNTLAGGGGAGNPNTGYLKVYVGTTVCYIPYWTAAVV